VRIQPRPARAASGKDGIGVTLPGVPLFAGAVIGAVSGGGAVGCAVQPSTQPCAVSAQAQVVLAGDTKIERAPVEVVHRARAVRFTAIRSGRATAVHVFVGSASGATALRATIYADARPYGG
jgi:hypothetical protein